jgi:phosphatidylserine/phosphatidylglycerophosphate/cardiolipin synthase-like enzyme
MEKKKIIAGIVITLILVQVALAYTFLNEAPKENVPEPELYFCPKDDCGSYLTKEIEKASKVDCAFFDVRLDNVLGALSKKHARLVVDERYHKHVKGLKAKKDTSRQLMHNKFCILDGEKIITGSFNPTENGNYKNNNHLIIITSKYLAKNYEEEFEELWRGVYGRGKEVKYPEVYLNGKLYENYFCPEDSCEKHVIENLKRAKTSIHFMTFSFTSFPIGDFLIQNKNKLEIKGIFEKMQSKNGQFERLNKSGLNVRTDKNPKNLHHKVFIIDEKIVVLGSYNPSKSGNEKNDENILIIHDEKIAKKFIKEFESVW